jgi:hypothetical protein
MSPKPYALIYDLDHIYMAVAPDLLRLPAYWTATPLDRQRTSHLARLELWLAA